MDEVRSLATDIGFDEHSLIVNLKYLALCGDILWFEQSDGLKNIIFHKPVELTEIFKVIVSHDLFSMIDKKNDGFRSLTNSYIDKVREDLSTTGTISTDTLKRILISHDYKDAYLPVILELLVKFDIGYLVPSRADIYR